MDEVNNFNNFNNFTTFFKEEEEKEGKSFDEEAKQNEEKKKEMKMNKEEEEEFEEDEDEEFEEEEENFENPFGFHDGLHFDPATPDPLPATKFGKFRLQLEKIVEHFAFRVLGLILIIVDICVLIVEFSSNDAKLIEALEITSLCFVTYFVAEVLIRILALGFVRFFTNWFNVIDFVIVFISFLVTSIYTTLDLKHVHRLAKFVVIGRLLRVVMFVRIYTAKKHVEKGARHMVSQNKRRYQKDGFDLDLTYVTERVIAMSFPSAGKMSIYRNPIKEVSRFLDTKHSNCYKVYNMCSERTYDDSYFHGRVERFLIDDHNVPQVKEMIRFTENVRNWFSLNPKNVIAVHCKGGKGRTGTMICIWLVESGLFESAGDSLDYFGFRRTDLNISSKFQGVETPSQSRYVAYYQFIKDELNGNLPQSKPMKIVEMKLTALAGLGKGNGSDFSCEIFTERNNKVFECHFGENRNCQTQYFNEADYLDVKLTNCPILCGDVKMRFHSTSWQIPRGYEKVPFYFWFHTSFIENKRLLIKRNELDNPHKPKTWQWFREKFSVEIIFEEPIKEEENSVPSFNVKL